MARTALVGIVCSVPGLTAAQEITFSVTGDVPYGTSEIAELQQHIDDHNLYSESDFLVHVGDILAGNEACDETRYITVANMLRDLAVPAFIVPGDNEWTDCQDPNQGWSYWMAHLFELEQDFCGVPNVERQSGREENFAFVQNGVLFVGINLVGGSNDSAIMQDDADWVSQQFSAKVSQVRAAVVFAQAGEGNNRSTFFNPFSTAAASFSKPILYIHGDGHSWQQQNAFLQPNVTRVQIDRGDKPPVHVTVAASGSNPFSFDRTPWSGGTPLYNRPPCADAGPNRAVSVSQAANLSGMASDDGVPNNPVNFSSTWTKISGPAGASIADPSAPSTSVSFASTGTYVFELEADDGALTASDQMQVVVSDGPPVNQAPVAGSDAYEIEKNTPLNVGAPGVLANDSDADGDPLTAVLVSGTSNGSLSLNVDGGFTYTPNTNFVGQDAFTYRADDGIDPSGVTTVTLDVTHYKLTFTPTEDARVNSALPAQNYGLDDELRVELDVTAYHSFLKFQVAGTRTTVYGAKVRLWVTNSSDDGGTMHAVSDYYTGTLTVWNENGLVWNNAPVLGTPVLDAVISPDAGTWVEFDVSGAVVGNGTYSFGIQSASDNSVRYSSKEGSFPPQLVVQTEPTGPQLTNTAPVANADAYVTDQGVALVVGAPGVLVNDTDANGDALSVVHDTAPSNGTVTVGSDGGFTYTPNPLFSGTDAFTYSLVDGRGGLDTATVSITVNTTNASPVATDDSFNGNEDQALVIAAPGVLGNDSDPDGDPLSAGLNTAPTNGSVTVNADGSFTYTPTPDFFGNDTFTYDAHDGLGGFDTASVTVSVQGAPDPPIAQADNYVAAEDSVLSVPAPGVLANDVDVDGDTLSATLTASPSNGSLTFASDGSFTYTPIPDYSGADAFTYAIDDGNGGTDSTTVTLDVQWRNDAPVAAADSFATDEDVVLSQPAPGLLANDSDIDGDPLTAALFAAPAQGTVVVNTDGSFTYTPAADMSGDDSFQYTASDWNGGTDVQTVTITVQPLNDAPSPANDSYNADEDAPLVVAAPGVLANDVDVDGDALTATLASAPSNGTVVVAADGGFTYTPNPDFNGADAFTYNASDGNGGSASASVSVNVAPQNDAPTPQADAYVLNEDTTLNEPVPGVLANDTDVDGDPLSASLTTPPTSGSVTLQPDGSFSYTPNADFNGTDGFTYQADDGAGGSAIQSVTLTVQSANDPPVAGGDAYTTDEDVVLAMAAPGLLGNDTDVDGDPLSASLVSAPSNGTVSVNADGSFTYTPNSDFGGSDSFTYAAQDGAGGSDTQSVAITVTPVNDAPTTVADSFTLNEEGELRVKQNERVLKNDFDVDGDALTATLAVPAVHGAVTDFASSGTFTYTPDPDFSGTDSLTYTAHDGNGGATNQVVTLIVLNTNDAPQAVADSYDADEDEALVVAAPGVLANDIDVDGDVLTATLNTGPSNGGLALQSDGGFTYTPNPGFTGNDSFSYTAHDGNGSTSTASVSLSVQVLNDPPTTVSDSYSVDEDDVLTVAAPGVLANDSDEENDPLVASVATGPTQGTLGLNADGSFTYTPAPDFHGSDGFTYVADDGAGGTTTESVTLAVQPINDAPATTIDGYVCSEDSALAIVAPGVLGNDSDVDGDALVASVVSPPANGTLVLNADGSFTYTPSANFSGADGFTYAAEDGNGGYTPQTVTLDVQAANDAPTVAADAYVTDEDVALVVPAPGVLANDADVDGDALTASIVSNPGNGTLVLAADGSFTYTPDPDFVGADGFTYQADDGNGGVAVGSVSITVQGQNDAPVAFADSFSTPEDVPLAIASPGVLGNDSDADGDTLTASVTAAPASGSVTLNADGSFTYTPNADFHGSDSFTYAASDGKGGADSALVTIAVLPENDAPTAVADAYATNEDTPLVMAAPGVLANDSDADGDALAVSLQTPPTQGTLTLNPDGAFTYTPNADFHGSDSFVYVADDGNGGSSPGSVSLSVDAVNDVPVALADAYAAVEDSVLQVAPPGVLANDIDVDGDALVSTLVVAPANGSLVLDPDGGFLYTPAPDFDGADAFTYEVDDGNGGTVTQSVDISVQPRNDPPVVANESYVVTEDTPFSQSAPGVLANDSDPDGDPLTVVVEVAPAAGILTLNADGSFDYVPEADFTGSDSFDYRVQDGNGASALGTATLNVSPLDDPPQAVADSFLTQEDVALNIAAPGVLANDLDADGDTLVATLVDAPVQGTLGLAADGGFVYTPAADFNGTDSFTYAADDGSVADTTLVTLIVAAVADAPVGTDDVYVVGEGDSLIVSAPGVLSNDTDADGDVLTATLVAAPTNGTLVLATDGAFTYVPEPLFAGADSFAYAVGDGTGLADSVAVSLTITGVNDAPTASADSFFVVRDGALAVGAPGVLGNDSDADGDTLSAVLVTDVQHGTLVLLSSGAFTYTPEAGYTGPDAFVYRATDGALEGGDVTVSLHVADAEVTFAESVTGAASNSAQVACDAQLLPVDTHLYVAAVSTAPRVEVQTLDGMGLVWTRVESQCSARAQTGIEMWVAQGTPTAGVVGVTFAQAPAQAALVVARFAGVAMPARGGSVSGNTLGPDGACSGGIDSDTYAFDLTTSSSPGAVLVASASWDAAHLGGAGSAPLVSHMSGDSTAMASVHLEQRPHAGGTQTFAGSFDASVDWAVGVLEVRSAVTPAGSDAEARRPAELEETRPNPFNAGTTLKYRLHARTPVEIVVYNVRGQVVRRLVREVQTPGLKRVYWDARTDAGVHTESGVYFIRIRMGEQSFIRKIILVK